MHPDLHLHSSNRLESLAEAFATLVSDAPSKALDSELVVVPAPGLARWLSFQVADRTGICMNYRFLYPGNFAGEMLNILFGLADDHRTLPSREHITWRIFSILSRFAGSEQWPELTAYLSKNEAGGDLKRIQLAERLAGLFDQYLYYRPEMVLAWEKGGHPNDWQACLWRELMTAMGHPRHVAHAVRELTTQGRQRRPAQLPGRISLFGLSHLPPLYIELLRQSGRFLPIHLFQLQPSPNYWGDIVSGKERARRAVSEEAREEWFIGNPLLGSMGRQSRDFSNLILEAGFNPDTECFHAPEPSDLLRMVQRDIFDLRDRTTDRAEERPDLLADPSITINRCHGPMREVEVLYDYLLQLFDTLPGLKPRDVIVLAPDIDVYAPFIEAIFSTPEDEHRRLPYHIADRQLRGVSPIVDAVFKVLHLTESRLSARDVMSILELPEVRRRFAFTAEELSQLRGWIAECGIRWGRDGMHRESLGGEMYEENSWRFGIRRMLAGYTMRSRDERLFGGGILGFDEIEGSLGDLLGRFLDVLEAILALSKAMEKPRSPAAWADLLEGMFSSLLLVDSEGESDLRLVRSLLSILREVDGADPTPITAECSAVGHFLQRALDRTYRGSGFLSGGITFGELIPMRSVPARALCLLGMNDGDFPRRSTPLAFDLLAPSPREGDRTVRESDRNLFLELLLSARERLYISFDGFSLRDNVERPPSVVVSALLDYLEGAVKQCPRSTELSGTPRAHRLQPFSPAYFSNGPLFSYSESCADAATGVVSPAKVKPPFMCRPLPPPSPSERRVALTQFSRFLRNPCRIFMEERLGMRLHRDEAPLDETEPMQLNHRQQYDLKQELVRASLLGQSSDSTYDLLRARGVLPVGPLGRAEFHELERTAVAFARRVAPSLGGERPSRREFRIPLGCFTLTGELGPIYGDIIPLFRCARVKARDYLSSWLLHLIIGPLEDLDAGPHWKVRLIAEDRNASFSKVDDPAGELEKLLGLYWEGLRQPLPLFPVSAHAFAETVVRYGDREPARKRARQAWNGSYEYAGEREEPHFRLIYGDGEALNEEFEAFALQVWQPLLHHLVEEKV